MTDSPKALKGEDVHVYVPRGTAKDVKIVEVDHAPGGNDITLHISRERKPRAVKGVGVIVK